MSGRIRHKARSFLKLLPVRQILIHIRLLWGKPGSLLKPVVHIISSVESNFFYFWANVLFLPRQPKETTFWLRPILMNILCAGSIITGLSSGLRIARKTFLASSIFPFETSHLGDSGMKENPINWIALDFEEIFIFTFCLDEYLKLLSFNCHFLLHKI